MHNNRIILYIEKAIDKIILNKQRLIMFQISIQGSFMSDILENSN